MADKNSTEIQELDIDNWKRGQISYFSKSRLQNDALKSAYNVVFDYDAIVRPRGGFFKSRVPDLPDGLKPLGCDYPFKRKDGTNGLMNIFTDGTNAYLYVLKADLSGWDKMPQTFNNTLTPTFTQIVDKVVLGNGTDKFTYYDISTGTVKRLTKVADPTATPKATPVGFSGTAAMDYYYRVAFSGVGGNTKMTPAVKVSSSTVRDTWGSSRSVAIDISAFTIDPNAQGWVLFVAGVASGTGAPTDDEYFPITNSLPVTQKSFTDTGESTLLGKAPVENTTEGINAWYFTNISGRLWAISNDNKVYWGGDKGNELYFGTANGSDSYLLNSGSIEKPMAVTLGRDNAGTTCINLLSQTIAGQGAIWDVYATTNSITANGQTFSTGTYQFKKREGNDGTDAPFSVIRENNNAYYLSTVGFKSTGVKPNVSGIQATDIISSAIRDRVANLSQSSLQNCYAAAYDEALYWTVSYGSTKNNEIWVYDILHGGIWSIWRIAADCIFRWAVDKGESPSLYIRQGNKLLRYFKNSHAHRDASGVFESYIESGLIPFKKSNLTWVHLLKAIWQFDQAVGKIDITLNVHSKNGDILKSSPIIFGETSASTAITSGWDAMRPDKTMKSRGSWDKRSWDESLASLLDLSQPGDGKADQKVRKNASYVSFTVRANTPDTYYELSHLSLLFTHIGNGIEFLSQKGVNKI